MDIESKIESLVSDLLETNKNLFLVEAKVSGNQGAYKVAVYIDGDTGVPIESCAKISRVLSERIDENGIIEGSYTLEVSSPGLDHPLKLVRQYYKNIGRKVKVVTSNDEVKTGNLVAVSDESIVIEDKEKNSKKKKPSEPLRIFFSDIKKTNVMASFK